MYCIPTKELCQLDGSTSCLAHTKTKRFVGHSGVGDGREAMRELVLVESLVEELVEKLNKNGVLCGCLNQAFLGCVYLAKIKSEMYTFEC